MKENFENSLERHYKEVPPEDTVFNIYSALHKCGIKTIYSQNTIAVNGCCSNRVTIDGTSLGSNGKGVNHIFALASGYAELAERLQNNMIYVGEHNPELFKENGFCYSPDEKWISKYELANANDAFMSRLYTKNKCDNYFDKIKLLGSLTDMMQKKWNVSEKGSILSVPFYSLKSKNTVYLPYVIYSKMYGSNGMSAGNTFEEAMVQGLSEIYERYVNRYILENSITPPSVPQSVLESSKMNDVIHEITKSGRYNVIVKDLSLGKGYPVLGTVISDRKTGNFGFRLGAHPSFEIALERTLTEAFQGRSIENFIGTASIGTDEQVSSDSNIYSIFRNGEGYYRSSLFEKEPDYEYTPFNDVSDISNRELMNYMLEPLMKNNYDVFIRQSGYLGLPALQIIIPGINEINDADLMTFRGYNTQYAISEGFGMGKVWSEDLKNRVVRYVKYKLYQNKITDCTIKRIFSRPFTYILVDSNIDLPLIISFIFYSMMNYDEAVQLIDSISLDSIKTENKTLVKCVSLYMHQIADGKKHDEVSELIHMLYEDVLADKICNWLCEPEKTMEKVFPVPPCWNCEECAYSKDGRCNYLNVYDVFRKLGMEMNKYFPNQEDLKSVFENI